MQEYEPQEPEKRSFLDRIFGAGVGDTRKAVAKMVLVMLFITAGTVICHSVGANIFALNSAGDNISTAFGFFASCFLARIAWVVKY